MDDVFHRCGACSYHCERGHSVETGVPAANGNWIVVCAIRSIEPVPDITPDPNSLPLVGIFISKLAKSEQEGRTGTDICKKGGYRLELSAVKRPL